MSHVATIEIEIKDLQDLIAASAELGLVFEEGQKTYEWFGESIGDYPLPEGFAANDLGHCEHAIRMNDSDRIKAINLGCDPYEIGVVKRRDGKPGWTLLWDFYDGGKGLERIIGPQANKLKHAVATAASVRTMARQGYRCQRQTLANGTVKLQFTK